MIELTITFDGEGSTEALLDALTPVSPDIIRHAHLAGFTSRGMAAYQWSLEEATAERINILRDAIDDWDEATPGQVNSAEREAGDELKRSASALIHILTGGI